MNILKINGTPLTGIWVDAAVSFNKPAKRVQTFQVPGRNGDLVVDEGTFDNVLISYPVYEKATFPTEFDSIVNWLASLEGYQRIECSNDPQHFRLGRFVVPTSPTAKRLNRDGYYQLSFDCKPQRYLNLGEVPTEINANPSETYGPADIVSFEAAQADTISGAEFGIEAVQDLHGYDAPWPAGGGKNLWGNGDISKDATNIYDNISLVHPLEAGTYTVSLKATGDQAIRLSFRTSGAAAIATIVADGTKHSATITLEAASTNVYFYGQGNASDRTAATATEIQVEAGSTATSFAPYSNICPITGFTGAEITAKGVNLWDGVYENSKWIGNYTTGAVENADSLYNVTDFIPVKPNTPYYHSNTGSSRIIFYDINKNAIPMTSWQYPNAAGTITSPAKAAYIRLTITNANLADFCFNYSSTNTTYHASVGTTHEVSWSDEAGTVYGGTLAYLGGDAWRLTATWTKYAISDLTFTMPIANTFIADASSMAAGKVGSVGGANPALCSCYKTKATRVYASGYDNGECGLSVAGTQAVFKDETCASIPDFTTKMAGQDFAYELATPVTYDLTGEELTRLVGKNNIFANCGQSTVVITEPTYFVNPGFFTSKPIIRVYGDGTFRVGDNIITIAAHTQPYIDIDSELQDCYYEDTNMNAYVTFGTGEYPVLVPGQNYILMGSGITKLIITPRWWEL